MNTQSKTGRPALRTSAAIAAGLSLSLMAIPAQAADVTSDVSFVAKASEVWSRIGAFCAMGDWYPGLESCTEVHRDGATLRRLVTGDGSQFLEKLVSHDDAAMTYTYSIEEGPFPVADYVSTISVTQIGDEARVEWSGTFAPNGVTEAEAVDVVTGIYDTGLEAIRQNFAK